MSMVVDIGYRHFSTDMVDGFGNRVGIVRMYDELSVPGIPISAAESLKANLD